LLPVLLQISIDLQQIIDAAKKFNRKVAVAGRSMVNVMSISALEMGYLDVPKGLLVDLDEVSGLSEKQNSHLDYRQSGRTHVRLEQNGYVRSPAPGDYAWRYSSDLFRL
jgi:mRNA degradation ribonuclease J1/J2